MNQNMLLPSGLDHYSRIARTLVLPMLLAGSVASSIAQVNYRVLAFTGDPIQTRRAEARLGSFADPAINNQNQVAYRSLLFGRGISPGNADSIVRQRLFRRTGSVIAQQAQPILNGYLAQGSVSPTVTDSSTDNGITTVVDTSTVVVSSQFGPAEQILSTSTVFGNRVALNAEGIVLFTATPEAEIGTSTLTTEIDDATNTIIDQVGDFAVAPQTPQTLFASDGAVIIPVISANAAGTGGATPSLGPSGLISFSGPFGTYANGEVALTGVFPAAGGSSVGGQAKFSLNPLFSGGTVSIQPIIVNGLQLPGTEFTAGDPFTSTPVQTIIGSTLPAINLGGIASTILSVGDELSGVWNFFDGQERPSFFLGAGSRVFDASGAEVGTFNSFDGVTNTIATSSRGLVVIPGSVFDNDGALTTGFFVTRIALNGSNINGTPSELTGPGPNANLQLPYYPNGSAVLSVQEGVTASILTPFPNTDRGNETTGTINTFGQPGINNRGTIVFTATATLGVAIAEGIFAVPFGALQPGSRSPVCIALEGDVITINGSPRRVSGLRFNPLNGLNDSNRVVYTVSFEDGTSAIMWANIQPSAGLN